MKEHTKGLWKGLGIGLATGLIIGFCGPKLISNNQKKPEVTAVEEPAESHDVILEDNGILGYTAADFKDAVAGKATKQKQLVVMEQDLHETTTFTQAGLANLSIFSMYKDVTYYATGVYTVDLQNIDQYHITVDDDTKTVTILIPHAVLQYVTPDLSKTEFEDTSKGLLAFGDIELTAEEQNQLEQSVINTMTDTFNEETYTTLADKYAKLSTWEIFQPIVSSVSPEYKADMKFVD
ncbi:MAG: DUF4230 domain-containing protein [Solobacterium sp.]|jgi:hypothetical protein|nr:DUF4230 domain-containing protein [Solobacterium sp.]MCH4223301.1 DUF4230 domain-containing protein [Solobacterium sp.]